jgi:hypothetical protein
MSTEEYIVENCSYLYTYIYVDSIIVLLQWMECTEYNVLVQGLYSARTDRLTSYGGEPTYAKIPP